MFHSTCECDVIQSLGWEVFHGSRKAESKAHTWAEEGQCQTLMGFTMGTIELEEAVVGWRAVRTVFSYLGSFICYETYG